MNELPHPPQEHSKIGVGYAKAEVWELIQALVLGRTPPDRILELYYWGQDACSLETARAAFMMPDESRATLRAFFSKARPEFISIKIDKAGRLIVSSPDISNGSIILQEIERQKAATDSAI